MAARPSTPNRISLPVAIPRRATLERVDWMAVWRRLREALLSAFIVLLPTYYFGSICSFWILWGTDQDRCRSDERWKMDGGGRWRLRIEIQIILWRPQISSICTGCEWNKTSDLQCKWGVPTKIGSSIFDLWQIWRPSIKSILQLHECPPPPRPAGRLCFNPQAGAEQIGIVCRIIPSRACLMLFVLQMI